MTILERLASMTSPILADMVKSHRESHEPEELDTPCDATAWDNRPTWDNWSKKDPPWSKKRIYFTKKNEGIENGAVRADRDRPARS